jgi:quinol-cytochrome oxidoreductase complex cytochrome b subunit
MKPMQKSQRQNNRIVTTRNFFLHIHSPHVHLYSLKPTYTFGLGLSAAFLFLILLVTGAILMLYYTPSIERAYASIKDIIFIVPGGRYLRNMHRWAGHGLVLVTLLHLVRVFYTAAYSRGRTFNWIVGISLFVISLFMSFSGYLLPWDQLAFWAVTIGANIAASFRELTDAIGVTQYFDVGGFVKLVLIGGESVGQAALTRFYMLHVVFLPITFSILVGLHLWRIRKDGGLNIPQNADNLIGRGQKGSNDTNRIETKITTWPMALWGELAVIMTLLALLMIFAYALDAPLLEPANPASPENPAKSPWYFLGIQELVSYSAFAGGIIIPLGFITFLISIPFRDKNTGATGLWFSGAMGARVAIKSAIIALLTTCALVSINIKFGWVRDWLPRTPQLLIVFINPGTILALLYAAWAIIIHKKTSSQRYAAISLFTCAIIGFIILTIVALAFRGPNWEFYWSPSYWPTS